MVEGNLTIVFHKGYDSVPAECVSRTFSAIQKIETMSGTNKKSIGPDIGKTTRKATLDARKLMQQAKASLEKFHLAKAKLKAFKKEVKQAKKLARKDAQAAAAAQEHLKLLLKRSAGTKRPTRSKKAVAKNSNRSPETAAIRLSA